MYSQNGWPLADASQLDRSPIPGTDIVPVPGVLSGDVATVLHQVGKLFNERIDRLYSPGCWGWNAPTVIPGSNVYSNHCSGTAIDFNAPTFPWKTRKMTPAQREACRQIVTELDSVVAWGGDYTTFVDEMHFEIVGDSNEVARVANKIKGGDDMLRNKTDVDRVFLATLHRYTNSEAEAKPWIGMETLVACDRIRSATEWLDQNHVLLVAHPATVKALSQKPTDQSDAANKLKAIKAALDIK